MFRSVPLAASILCVVSLVCPAHAAGRIKSATSIAEAVVAFPDLKFDRPIFVAAPPDGTDRLFVVEQIGKIFVIPNRPDATPDDRHLALDLNLRNRRRGDERGLLGLAFHPDYANNGKFYVAYSGPLDWQGDLGQMLWYSHSNIVSEFTVSADDPYTANRT
ncbi:MAG: hypothetical protein AAFX76_12200, partial [Planctomycetota bacterium]